MRLVLRLYLHHRQRCSLCGHIAEAKDDISLRERLRPQKKVPKDSEEDDEEEEDEDEAENKAADAAPSKDAARAATS